MIDYTCPHCGQKYSLGEEWSGKEALCPKCSHVIQVPASAPGSATAALAAMGAVAAPPRPPAPPPGFQMIPQPATLRMMESLRSTRPWVNFLAVLGFIGCGLMVLGGLFITMVGASTGLHRSGMGIPPYLGILYLFVGAIYFMPSYYLLKYGGAIGRFLRTGAVWDMEAALESQKSFWRFVGIFTLVMLCLYALLLVGMLLFVASATRS